MKTKYRVRWATTTMVEILELPFAKETELFVMLDDGRREKKRTDWQNWFDTEDEAVEFIYSENEKQMQIAKNKLEYAVNTYTEIKNFLNNRKKYQK